MWEIMWSWWWVKPLPSEKHFIRKDNNIKENNNNLIKNWLRASLKKRSRQSRCKSVNNNNNHKRSKDQVKFLYESKSGKSFRQSGNYGEYINPYFQKNTIGYVTIEYESYYVWYFSFWLVIVERFQVWRGTFHVDIVSVWTSWRRVQKLRRWNKEKWKDWLHWKLETKLASLEYSFIYLTIAALILASNHVIFIVSWSAQFWKQTVKVKWQVSCKILSQQYAYYSQNTFKIMKNDFLNSPHQNVN